MGVTHTVPSSSTVSATTITTSTDLTLSPGIADTPGPIASSSDTAARPASISVSFSTAPISSVIPISVGTVPHVVLGPVPVGVHRRGKAPAVDACTGENTEIRFQDWLPTLDRATSWNGWSDGESLKQLAGHLRGRALQEWNLLCEEEKATYQAALHALRIRLNPGNRVLAAQDFRHAIQKESEGIADYVRSTSYHIMKSPSVSGSQSYKELCMAAKHEEKRVAELRRHQHYQRSEANRGSSARPPPPYARPHQQPNKLRKPPTLGNRPRRCYNCDSTEHLARDCKAPKRESIVQASRKERSTSAGNNTQATACPQTTPTTGRQTTPTTRPQSILTTKPLLLPTLKPPQLPNIRLLLPTLKPPLGLVLLGIPTL